MTDDGSEREGAEDCEDGKLEAMEPDWCTVKHSGGGPEDKGGEIVGFAPVKGEAEKEEKKEKS